MRTKIRTAEQARREALWNLRANSKLNAPGGQNEHAYSPSTCAVGMRESGCGGRYRICNMFYPMYGRADQVSDWVSVGVETPKLGWHWRKVGGVWKQFKNIPGKSYTLNEDGCLVPV